MTKYKVMTDGKRVWLAVIPLKLVKGADGKYRWH